MLPARIAADPRRRTWWAPLLLVFGCTLGAACAAPAPGGLDPTRPPATVRVGATATPRADPTSAPLDLLLTRVEVASVPPAEPTPEGLASGRPTPTPAATPDAAWKYLTLSLAVDNRSDTPRLVGIGGSDPGATNLAGAVLTTRDGQKFKPIRSSTSLGLRTASGRSLTSYPVLLRLPPGFRAAAESFGASSTMAPIATSLVFKLPAAVSDYGTLTVPPLTNLGPKTDDDVTRRLRPLIGGFQPLEVGAASPGTVDPGFPLDPRANAPAVLAPGTPLVLPDRLSLTVGSPEITAPTDYQARNRGWKQLALSVGYRNDDPRQAQEFNVAAWFFGADGVVYSGDVPSIGDFGRASAPPEPAAMLLWDGRAAGVGQLQPGQAAEPRRLVFLVPSGLREGVLVLSGEVEALFQIQGLATPQSP